MPLPLHDPYVSCAGERPSVLPDIVRCGHKVLSSGRQMRFMCRSNKPRSSDGTLLWDTSRPSPSVSEMRCRSNSQRAVQRVRRGAEGDAVLHDIGTTLGNGPDAGRLRLGPSATVDDAQACHGTPIVVRGKGRGPERDPVAPIGPMELE